MSEPGDKIRSESTPTVFQLPNREENDSPATCISWAERLLTVAAHGAGDSRDTTISPFIPSTTLIRTRLRLSAKPEAP